MCRFELCRSLRRLWTQSGVLWPGVRCRSRAFELEYHAAAPGSPQAGCAIEVAAGGIQRYRGFGISAVGAAGELIHTASSHVRQYPVCTPGRRWGTITRRFTAFISRPIKVAGRIAGQSLPGIDALRKRVEHCLVAGRVNLNTAPPDSRLIVPSP